MKECKARRKPKLSGRICRIMRPNMRRKQAPNSVCEVIPSTPIPSYYDLVTEDIEGFLQIANAHTSELREFLGVLITPAVLQQDVKMDPVMSTLTTARNGRGQYPHVRGFANLGAQVPAGGGIGGCNCACTAGGVGGVNYGLRRKKSGDGEHAPLPFPAPTTNSACSAHRVGRISAPAYARLARASLRRAHGADLRERESSTRYRLIPARRRIGPGTWNRGVVRGTGTPSTETGSGELALERKVERAHPVNRELTRRKKVTAHSTCSSVHMQPQHDAAGRASGGTDRAAVTSAAASSLSGVTRESYGVYGYKPARIDTSRASADTLSPARNPVALYGVFGTSSGASTQTAGGGSLPRVRYARSFLREK
ncbi:hypothetical protein B0H13DRAFT_1875826 [Mycena leptocephala]|nr:hypothetical protein B0H13DRAFT_1875826 [Mycena leptocephala]